MTGSGPVLRAEAVSRTFRTPAGDVHAVRGVTLEAHSGELVVVRGPSGSGKTTLLNLLGGLDVPTDGTVRLAGTDTGAASEADLLALRRDTVGFVFQSFGLLGVLTALENVEVPLRVRRLAASERSARASEALRLVGLGDHGEQRPDELSGGQQQRVAIARALAADPAVLIADEPTGQLDSRTGEAVMELVVGLVHERGLAAVIATHDAAVVARADRVVTLHDGALLRAV
ncbi:putative ABC transport system ATP-binding protein [Mumia flava]|uniref:Putative ABC transport system ATP-binding protein n=1 Tax=Mumia flava TaxID=1348852 RepID=A0A0B2BCS1_9ACTN|nr:ABC transporter ATP-binding protein [Mumia flava]PJJ57535.1 putative ABC transport system ATP-binding protein [Mumia flava]